MDSKFLIPNSIKWVAPENVVVVEHWYDRLYPFKVLVNGEYWFWSTSKEHANDMANSIRENREVYPGVFPIR